MSRKWLFLMCLVLPVVLVCGVSWAKGKTKQNGPKTWVVHIQRMDMNGQSGLWPESTSYGGTKRNLPLLHRSNGDKIQFVIDSGADSCQVVFDDGSPLVAQGQPNATADTITVYTSTGTNGIYVVSPKLQIPKGGYCSYWFHILGNPDCASRPHTCSSGKPIAPGKQNPCWAQGKSLQIGPGMETAD